MSPEPQTGSASRIAADLRAAIADGRFGPGAKLPTVRDLTEQYGVSRNTASKAIAQLSNEGVIITRYGSGAYVREAHPVRRVGQDRYAKSKWANSTVEVYEDERHEGQAVEEQGTQTQDVELLEADERVARALNVAVGTQVWKRDRIMFRDGRPSHTVTSYYRRGDVEGTAIVDPRPGMAGAGGSFAIFTELGLAPDEMTEELFARMPTVAEMVALELPSGEPVVEQWRTTRTADGRAIECARGVHPASRFVWSYTFKIPD